jgi:hypothetical protein
LSFLAKATDFPTKYLETTEGEKAYVKNWSEKENGTCESEVCPTQLQNVFHEINFHGNSIYK